jgi:hypothetical protein
VEGEKGFVENIYVLNFNTHINECDTLKMAEM